MTSKLVCPFCGEELRQSKYIEPLTGQNLYFCDTHDCYPTECVIGTQSMWQALIQAKQDLEIATKALEEIDWCAQDYAKAQEALEHITRDNSEKPNSQEHKE